MSAEAPVPVVVENVSYVYRTDVSDRQVLDDVSMQIAPGEIVILTGPSGSGKTTLITLIGALRAVQSGSVQVLGREILNAGERDRCRVRQQVGYIFQHHNLLDSLTVAQNVMMSLQLSQQKLSRKEQRQRVIEVLERVGLGEHVDKHPRALSGGQNQRAGIARALVTHPRLILADEPTASLDKESGRNVVDLIQELCREQGTSVALVTHDNRILDVADNIMHLEDGKIQTVSEAMATHSSRMLKLLNKHDPGAAQYLSAFALALTRVAMADSGIDDAERTMIRTVLNDSSKLSPGEVDLVMELALSQLRCRQQDGDGGSAVFSADQAQHFLDSLYAVAAADGEVSPEERVEIQNIARELGFPVDSGRL
ncbi:ATP-binding cassette domain-containing protein [Pseudohalioglobus sediminis]|uniref:Cell division ATP-binding protein FtsE n=1 Tax=Pseudohalioglobus sediminis TaxID=2606449 RepID=A0A5B0WV63_9GAMM|nr:ATP-binding cassette domain-containing protein [Pseudohalioglobus sediminis]KAA1190081.1 ATP-binding cassette domain-containing protein [Pseudohalioglobus sediminis]